MSIEEMEARIAAAEGKYETLRLAALEWGKDIDTHSRLIDKLWQRVEALEAAQQPHQDKMDRLIAIDRDDSTEDAAQQPSLLDRVTWLIAARFSKSSPGTDCTPFGRAAILEVAAWLREQHGGDLIAATVLRREANR